MTFIKILSLLIGVISPVRELGGSFQSQSVLCGRLEESGFSYDRKWTGGGMAADRRELGFIKKNELDRVAPVIVCLHQRPSCNFQKFWL